MICVHKSLAEDQTEERWNEEKKIEPNIFGHHRHQCKHQRWEDIQHINCKNLRNEELKIKMKKKNNKKIYWWWTNREPRTKKCDAEKKTFAYGKYACVFHGTLLMWSFFFFSFVRIECKLFGCQAASIRAHLTRKPQTNSINMKQ